jgi:predicted TIM-barrel fold metal-dependent hydrolase
MAQDHLGKAQQQNKAEEEQDLARQDLVFVQNVMRKFLIQLEFHAVQQHVLNVEQIWSEAVRNCNP